MKVISLWEPWASLVCLGHKCYETRSWATKHRGPILIHAAKKWSKRQERYLLSVMGRISVDDFKRLVAATKNRGSIIGRVSLWDCIEAKILRGFPYLSKDELYYGDFSGDRWGWDLRGPQLFEKPIPAIGRQRIFNYTRKLPEVTLVAFPGKGKTNV